MPFPRKLLNEGEDIVLDLHPHWWFFVKELAICVAVLVLGSLKLLRWKFPDAINRPTDLVLGLLILACLVWFGARYADWATTHFVVTSDRLIYRHGVLAKQGIEIPLERVNTVFFGQSIWERMLGTGDLVIESAGERGQESFSNVRHPSDVQNEIYKQMEANKNRDFDRIGDNIREAQKDKDDDDGPSIPQQIRELDQLRKDGLLDDDEYKRKKQELLDRM